MQQVFLLHGRPGFFQRASLLKAFRAMCFLTIGGLLEVAPAGAVEINTLSANANCDTVGVRQARRQEEEDKIDWYAVGREHREYTSRELLPEHETKEPETDTVIGCAIKNVEGFSRDRRGAFDEAELAEMDVAGWAKSAAVAEESEDEAEHEGVVRPQNKTDEPERDLIEYLGSIRNSVYEA